jgi:hypothetical protein
MNSFRSTQKFFPVAISYGGFGSIQPSSERIVRIRECSSVGAQQRVWARVAAIAEVRIFNVRIHRAPMFAERLEHKKQLEIAK